jgi:hypothetical protein
MHLSQALGCSIESYKNFRQDMVERMAAVLLEYPEGLQSDSDAVRILTWKGFGMRYPAFLAEDARNLARYLAKQTQVGEEMSRL